MIFLNYIKDENHINSRVYFSRSQLLSMSSVEFDEYVNKLNEVRELNQEEKKIVKTYRRMIKNREYASSSRAKKKAEFSYLKKHVEILKNENNELKKEIERLKRKLNYRDK